MRYSPYHSNRQWRKLRDDSPAERADAVAFDRATRHGHPAVIHGAAVRGKALLLHSPRPLNQVDPPPTDAPETDGSGNDCQRVCGL